MTAEDVDDMKNSGKWKLLYNVEDIFMIFKWDYDPTADFYHYVIWDERLQIFQLSSSTISAFCIRHLDAEKLVRSQLMTAYEVSSDGVTKTTINENKS